MQQAPPKSNENLAETLATNVRLAFLVIVGILSFMSLRAIAKGFMGNKCVMEKAEEALGLFDKGVYLWNAKQAVIQQSCVKPEEAASGHSQASGAVA